MTSLSWKNNPPVHFKSVLLFLCLLFLIRFSRTHDKTRETHQFEDHVTNASSINNERRRLFHIDERIRWIGNSTFDLAREIQAMASKQPTAEIKQISLIAERHSGSTWFFEVLQKAFPKTSVKQGLCTYKHWFQDRFRNEIMSGKRACRKFPCYGCKTPEHTLVINLWRNPYDWMIALQEVPWHMQSHNFDADKLGWKHHKLLDFMKQEYCVTAEHWQYLKNKKQNDLKKPCLDNFMPGDLDKLCSSWHFIYETAKGDPHAGEDGPAGLVTPRGTYAHAYALRRAKIRDFLAVARWAPHFHTLQYEQVLLGGPEGLVLYLGALAQRHGLEHRPEAYRKTFRPGAREKLVDQTFYGSMGTGCKSAKRPKCAYLQEPAALRHFEERLFDEELEGRLGYKRLPPPPAAADEAPSSGEGAGDGDSGEVAAVARRAAGLLGGGRGGRRGRKKKGQKGGGAR